MKKTVIALTLGLGLAMTGFAQSTAKKPKSKPSLRKSVASNPIVADDRDRAATLKSKPPKPKAPDQASGPTVIKAKPQPSQLMMALDANGDGKLSLEEIKAAVQAFKKLDENEDGELTLNEFGPAPKLAKQSRDDRNSVKSRALSSTLKAGAKPSGRPSRRPTAKPSGQLGKRPTTLANRTTPATKKPSAKRPSARPRPSSKPGQANRGDGTSAKAGDLVNSGGASTAKTSPRRVAKKAPARKVSKAARTVDPDIQTLIDETSTVTELIRKETTKIKNLAKRQLAQNWTRRGSRALLRSLNNIQAQDKAAKLVEAKQKLEEVRKLLE